MKKTVFCSLLALMGYTASQAQVSFGIEGGANYSNYNVKATDYTGATVSQSTTAATSFRAGVDLDFGLSDNFSIQPGVLYVVNGYSVSQMGLTGTVTVNTLTIPLNFIYKTGQPGGGRLFFGAGPYLGYNLSGTKNASAFGISNSASMNFGTDQSKDDMKAIDYGVGANVGYQFAFGLFIRLNYQMGLANLTVASGGGTITNYNAGGTLGFMFGGGGGGHKTGKVGKHKRSRKSEMPWR